jgi:L-ascorbate metabolism protein UlaG (beta-lactamase superfamily)
MKRGLYRSALTFTLLLAAGLSHPAQAAELLWYGQSAFRIDTPGGKVILIDPFITKNPKTPERLKDLGALGKVDLILLTHAHGDHVGDTVAIAKASGAKVAMNADLGQTFATLGLLPREQLIRFNKSGPIKPLDGVTVTMVRAEHSSELVHTDPETKAKSVHPGGEPAGYVVELENGFKIYHAGDTGVFGDMAFIGGRQGRAHALRHLPAAQGYAGGVQGGARRFRGRGLRHGAGPDPALLSPFGKAPWPSTNTAP